MVRRCLLGAVHVLVLVLTVGASSGDPWPVNISCPDTVCKCTDCAMAEYPDFQYHCVIKDLRFTSSVNSSRNFCSLDFSNHRIKSIKKLKFKALTRVLNLSLSYNSIEKMQREEFSNGLLPMKYLYLDHNCIKVINKRAFWGLLTLEYLNLDYNELIVLRADMFGGLLSLRHLSVAHNQLSSWKGSLYKQLPSLLYLNVVSNNNFTLNKRLLRNTTLTEIRGGTISEDCQQCNLFRTSNASQNEIQSEMGCKYIPDEHLSSLTERYSSDNIRFTGECRSKKCELRFGSTPNLKEIYKDRCWETVRLLKPVEYILGSIATLTNAVVLLTIVATKSLLRKASFLLMAHLALCDLLIGVYSILVATGHEITEDALFRSWRTTHCPYYRSLLVLGQTMGVITSLLMTTERYLAIVHCMRPNLRVTPSITIITLIVFWPLGAGVCVLLQYFDNVIIRDNLMCVLVQSLEVTDNRFLISQGLIVLLVFLYLFVVGMYIHIYWFVRKSAITAGIHRETKLAKIIGFIVFSNLIFFAIPNLSIVVFTVGMLDVSSEPVTNLITRVWLPPICMVINSCLNPLLFAFRNDKFLRSLKRGGRKVSRKVLTFKYAKEVRSFHLNVDEGYQMYQMSLATSSEFQVTLKSVKESSRCPSQD